MRRRFPAIGHRHVPGWFSAMGWWLYLRSRALPTTLAVLVGGALVANWAAHWLDSQPGLGQGARAPVALLGPVLAAAVIGGGLHSHSDELDRTAARPWWPRRGGHLVLLGTLAAGLLAVAVPGHPTDFGAPATARNALGATGVTALAAVVVGARLSWVPMLAYGSGLLLAPTDPGGSAAVWAWADQPGPQHAAWWTAAGAFAAGAAAYALRGAGRGVGGR